MLNNWDISIWEYSFSTPLWLLLLLIVPFVGWYLFRREKKRPSDWKYTGASSTQAQLGSKWIPLIRKGLILCQLMILTCLILALAKPIHLGSTKDTDERYKYGIDIILAMDVSLSMLAMDFEPNRLEVAKNVAMEFVDKRFADRIGLVAYAGEAYTACPATLDHVILKQQIQQIGNENLESGTAIGTGLGTAVTRLRSDGLPSKVIILLTDGSNNAGQIDPLTAATLAKAKNIRVYTIGVGSNGEAPTPVITPFGIRYERMPVEIDETTLKEIASITNAKYFRATDENSLKAIYQEIEQLEKRKLADRMYEAATPPTPLALLNWSFVGLLFTWIVNTLFFKMND
jgi:Ca-activated chloride channel family protein